jgi:DNA-directed RNA polymerase subunit RPC12/RpoP
MYSNSKEYEESRRLLVRAIASAKADEILSAKRMLERILRLPSTFEQTAEAHFWLSEISEDPEEKRGHLEQALGHNPTHRLARRNLAIINGKLEPSKIIDPDNINPQVTTEPIISTGERFVCGNCGGTLTYTPDGKSLICEYCQSRERMPTHRKMHETDFVIGISTSIGHKKAESIQSFECKACGAVFVLSPEILSLTCPHCDSKYTISSLETSELIPPEGIIPFEIGIKEIDKIVINWLKEKRISKPPHIGTFTGIYLPIWTFDISGYVKWSGKQSQNETYIPVTDRKHVFFDDILIPASIQQPYKFKEILRGYKNEDFVPYSQEYTANWLAETYTVKMSDAALDARSEAYKATKQILSKDDDLREIININFSSAGLIVDSFKLILIPVWLGEFTFSGHHFSVTINGKTGGIQGELPPTRLERFSKWLFENE